MLDRVLVIAKAFPPDHGGVETYSEQVARAYARRGAATTVVTQFAGERGLSRRGSGPESFDVVNVGEGPQVLVMVRMIRALARMRRLDPQLVHATTWRVAVPARVVRIAAPLCITVHGREVLNGSAPARALMRLLLRSADGVVTVSRATMDVAVPVLRGREPRGRWRVALNGLSSHRTTAPHPADGPATALDRPSSTHGGRSLRLLCFARLVERKNIQGCLRAVGRLVREGVDVDLTVAGDGPMRRSLEELAAKEELEGRVTFLGRVPDHVIPELYASHDVFVHPQLARGDGVDFEGFGLVIADAMAAGAVVVVGGAGGPRDFVTDGVTGLVVDGEDQAALEDALRQLVADPAAREAMSRAGSRWARENLSWDRHVAVVLDAVARG